MAETVLPSELEAPSQKPVANDPLTRVIEGLAAIGTLWIFALMFLVVADVVGRDFFKRPIVGVAEMAGNSIIGIVFLQLASAVNSGRMTRADFLIDMMGGPSAKSVQALETLFAILGAVAMAIITRAVFPNLIGAYTGNEFFGVQGLFTIPTWPIYGLMVLGSALSAVVYLRLAWRSASSFLNNRTA